MADVQSTFWPTLRSAFKPWYIKLASVFVAACAIIGGYAGIEDQFPALPKLQDVVLMSHVMLLPWWGWLLVLQAVFVWALFDYIRRTIPPKRGDNQDGKTTGAIDGSDAETTRLRADLEELDRRTAILPNLGTTWMEAYREIEKAVNSQIGRIRDETKPLVDRGNGANFDLLYLLDWALTRTETMLVLPELLSLMPRFDLRNPPQQAGDRNNLQGEMRGWRGQVVSVLQYLPSGAGHASTLQSARVLADHALKKIPINDRPAAIDPFEYREFYILGCECSALETMLNEMREVVKTDTLSTLSALKTRANSRRT